jgi:ZIP family zinc transporter
MLVLLFAGGATALATGVGVLPVFWIREGAERLRAALLGFAAGVMGVASIVGLLVPGLREGSTGAVAGGLVAGVAFLLIARSLVSEETSIATEATSAHRTSVLVFAVLLAHSLPEGLAIGTASASHTAGLGLFVIFAIAIQNVPEGTAVAIPMAAAGYGRRRQFWAAVLTSAPQPIAAPLAYLLVRQVEPLLPFSFGFAAGAMLALVLVEMLPDAVTRGGWHRAGIGVLAGAALMYGLSLALSVE